MWLRVLIFACSTYPLKRADSDAEGKPRGIIGSVELLNARVCGNTLQSGPVIYLLQILAPQPFVGFDWSPDKEGLAVAASLDQAVRVFIVTKLNKF